MDQAPLTQAMRRFTKHMIIGAVISGVVCSIPIISCINLLFCVLNMGGIIWALQMYLKAFPDDMLNTNESLLFGAIAGAGAGLIVGILGAILSAIFGLICGGFLASAMAGLPNVDGLPVMGLGAGSIITTIVLIPVWVVLYAGFGLLGSFLGMKLFFKTRLTN
ncbi:MAG: hypothetical protein LBC63_02790 [Holophagales bacterium]|nr:hypothetical protein [Holophagales bacterium]